MSGHESKEELGSEILVPRFHPPSSIPISFGNGVSSAQELENMFAKHSYDPLGNMYKQLVELIHIIFEKKYLIKELGLTEIISSIIISYLPYIESTLTLPKDENTVNTDDNCKCSGACQVTSSIHYGKDSQGTFVLFIQPPETSLYPTKSFVLSKFAIKVVIDEDEEEQEEENVKIKPKTFIAIETFDYNNLSIPGTNDKNLIYKNSVINEKGLLIDYPNCVLKCGNTYMLWFTALAPQNTKYATLATYVHNNTDNDGYDSSSICKNYQMWNKGHINANYSKYNDSDSTSHINRWSHGLRDSYYVASNHSNHYIVGKSYEPYFCYLEFAAKNIG